MLLLLSITALAVSCDVINPAESIPTYIKIDSFNFQQIDPVDEGPVSTNISSVWIYYKNNPVGVFDIPCNVPVITEGDKGSISVAPGITLNGLKDLQPQYVFYSFDTTTLVSNPGKVFEYTPTTHYIQSTVFQYKEDFETGNSLVPFYEDVIDDTSIVQTFDATKVKFGGAAGYLYLDSDRGYAELTTNSTFDISDGDSYLELDYKCSVPFQVGLYNTLDNTIETYSYIIGINPSEKWNKLYIDLGTYTSTYQGKDFKLMIKAALPDGASSGYLLLDNLKVVSF